MAEKWNCSGDEECPKERGCCLMLEAIQAVDDILELKGCTEEGLKTAKLLFEEDFDHVKKMCKDYEDQCGQFGEEVQIPTPPYDSSAYAVLNNYLMFLIMFLINMILKN